MKVSVRNGERFFATAMVAAFCISLLFSCTTNIEPPPPPTDGSSSSSELFSSSSSGESQGNVSCKIGNVCRVISEEACAELKGTEVPSCEDGSSSSSGESQGNVFCKIGDVCRVISEEACDMLKGTEVPSCEDGGDSSSSVGSNTSSSSSVSTGGSSSSSVGGSSSSSLRSSSSLSGGTSSSAGGSSASTRCKNGQGSDYFCEWGYRSDYPSNNPGCFAIDPAYSDPGTTCSSLVTECQLYGTLFTSSTVEGEGIRCNSGGSSGTYCLDYDDESCILTSILASGGYVCSDWAWTPETSSSCPNGWYIYTSY